MFSAFRQILKFIECYTMERNNNNIPYELSDYVLEKYFRETGERQGWFPENGRKIIVAASGGGDSIALLWLCKKFYKGNIIAFHVNHGIRGAEADADEKSVEKISCIFNIGFISIKASVPSEKMKGESLETAARRIRYNNLCYFARSLNADVFLGHNRDDLAETVLFNILRGTGIRGSVGITESTELEGVKFYRPLLGLRREFLRDILRVRKLTWREDSSNSDDKYTRNFIRLKLLPLIEKKINSSAVEHLAKFGEDMRAVREQENSASQKLFNEYIEERTPFIVFSRKKLKELDENQIALIIREAGRKLNLKTLSRDRGVELVKLINKTGNFIFQWCNGFSVKSMKGKIIFEDLRNAD